MPLHICMSFFVHVYVCTECNKFIKKTWVVHLAAVPWIQVLPRSVDIDWTEPSLIEHENCPLHNEMHCNKWSSSY